MSSDPVSKYEHRRRASNRIILRFIRVNRYIIAIKSVLYIFILYFCRIKRIKMKSFVFPGNIEQQILNIGSQPIPYMRTEFFSGIVKECEQILLNLMGCEGGRVIFYTASGTAAMDAAVACYVTTRKKTLAIAGGSFGYRWHSLCEYYHTPCELFEVPFAQDIDYTALERRICEIQPEVLLCQHHETSSGQLFNLEKISQICQKHQVKLIVDAISSFLADPYDMDRYQIDMTIISSQKGLNILPGLSFIILSERILQETFAHRNFYLDFDENLKNLVRGQTPYSPATSLFLQLHTRLLQIQQSGTRPILEKVQENALYFREKCKENDWLVPASTPSNCITGFYVHKDGYAIFKELLKQEIYIMPGGIKNFLRVSHLGCQNFEDCDMLARLIKELENCL